jgi:aryl-alcohol dehydrogenase-like predicted oxidoreductase
VALAWGLHPPGVASVIIGAKTNEQLADNIGATDLRLSESDLQTLNDVSKLPPEYPGWMFERQNRDRFPGGAIT